MTPLSLKTSISESWLFCILAKFIEMFDEADRSWL
jgi:hypothetical protein